MQKIEFISAPWCGRCKTIKPDVITLCQAAGVPLTFVNLDDMEDADTIKSLPTLRTYTKGDVLVHTATTLEEWKVLLQKAAAAMIMTTGTDF